MAKQLIYDETARRSLKHGIDNSPTRSAVTLGPKGRNVVLDKKYGAPTITNDGVTIAREIELEDPFENMGAQLLKEVATKTDDVAGDGTTTAIVLGQAIVAEGLQNVTAGANPMVIKRGLEKGVEAIVADLKRQSRPVETHADIAAVAAISAADAEVGEIIADVMDKVGKDGVITVEEGQSVGLETDYTEGMQFDRGYLSPYLVTNPERMEAVLEDALILVTDKKISAVKDLLPSLEKAMQQGKPTLIIAEDVDGEALATLVVNKLRGTLAVLAVKAPGFGDRRKEMLRDMAVLTGAQVISEELGRKLDSVTAEDFGHARRVVATKDDTTLIDGAGSPDDIKARMSQIKAQIEDTTSRLRQGEAPGAARQAGRRRRRHQGRRGHRGRAQGEEAPHRGRALDDARSHRGGPRGRWRRRAPAGHPCPRPGRAGGRRGRRPAASCVGPSRRRSARSPTTRARTARSSSRASRGCRSATASMRSRASTATCSPRASWTPPRSRAPRSRTRLRSGRWSSPPRPLITDLPEKKQAACPCRAAATAATWTTSPGFSRGSSPGRTNPGSDRTSHRWRGHAVAPRGDEMNVPNNAAQAADRQVEFRDRLRGYRFASALRGSGAHPGVRIWHTNETVLVSLVAGRTSDASLTMLRDEFRPHCPAPRGRDRIDPREERGRRSGGRTCLPAGTERANMWPPCP